MNDAEHKKKFDLHSPAPALVILSGPGRGRREILSHKTYLVKLDEDESVHLIVPDGEVVHGYHATLHRSADTYEIEVAPGHNIWVNGEQVRESRVLATGDLLEIGHKGPLLRYRIHPHSHVAGKSLNELVADCYQCAQVDNGSRIGRTYRFLANIAHDMATQTTPWFRIWVIIILTLLAMSTAYLVLQNVKLQQRVITDDVRIESMEKLLAGQDKTDLSQQDLLDMQSEVENQLAGTLERLEQLESGTGRTARVIAASTPAIVFVLGSYGLRDPDTGLLFRYRQSVDGRTTQFTYDNDASPIEIPFTGTAFVVTSTGEIITNRHVVEPWRNDPQIEVAQGRNLEPVIIRLQAYYPGIAEPVTITEQETSEVFDLALLRGANAILDITPLEFRARVPPPGEKVLLLGYPTGIRALVARASPEYLESLPSNQPMDHWTIADRLSESGHIKPLATSGIVGQVTDRFVVYDAETTFGGSGGPVLDENGRVIAINAAILPEFGGSNMGVSAQHALYFLSQNREWKKFQSQEQLNK